MNHTRMLAMWQLKELYWLFYCLCCLFYVGVGGGGCILQCGFMVIRMYRMWGKDKLPHFPLSSQDIWHYCNLSVGQVPGILPQLQKSVQAILLGRAQLPDWFNSGVRAQSHTTGFPLPPVAGQFVHFEGIQGSPCPLWQVSWYILKVHRVAIALCGWSVGTFWRDSHWPSGRSVCTFWRYTGFPLPPVAGQLVRFVGIQGSHCPLWLSGGTFWRDSHCLLGQVTLYNLREMGFPLPYPPPVGKRRVDTGFSLVSVVGQLVEDWVDKGSPLSSVSDDFVKVVGIQGSMLNLFAGQLMDNMGLYFVAEVLEDTGFPAATVSRSVGRG